MALLGNIQGPSIINEPGHRSLITEVPSSFLDAFALLKNAVSRLLYYAWAYYTEIWTPICHEACDISNDRVKHRNNTFYLQSRREKNLSKPDLHNSFSTDRSKAVPLLDFFFDSASLFNPCPAEPGYTLPMQKVSIQISWLLKKPTDLDLHCLYIKYLNLYQQPC